MAASSSLVGASSNHWPRGTLFNQKHTARTAAGTADRENRLRSPAASVPSVNYCVFLDGRRQRSAPAIGWFQSAPAAETLKPIRAPSTSGVRRPLTTINRTRRSSSGPSPRCTRRSSSLLEASEVLTVLFSPLLPSVCRHQAADVRHFLQRTGVSTPTGHLFSPLLKCSASLSCEVWHQIISPCDKFPPFRKKRTISRINNCSVFLCVVCLCVDLAISVYRSCS